MNAFNGTSAEFSVQISDSSLARVHYIIRTNAAKLPEFHESDIEAEIARLVRGWVEELHQLLVETHGEEQGNALFNRYKGAFPVAYREEFAVRNAVLDIQHVESVNADSPLAMKLYRPFHRGAAVFNLKLFREGEALGLSASLPILRIWASRSATNIRTACSARMAAKCGSAISAWMLVPPTSRSLVRKCSRTSRSC